MTTQADRWLWRLDRGASLIVDGRELASSQWTLSLRGDDISAERIIPGDTVRLLNEGWMTICVVADEPRQVDDHYSMRVERITSTSTGNSVTYPCWSVD